MTTVLTHIIYYLGPVLYLASAVSALRYLSTGSSQSLTRAARWVSVGAVLLCMTFAARWIRWGRLPLTSGTDTLLIFTVMNTIIILVIARKQEARALLCFYLPPIALICAINAGFAPLSAHEPPVPLRSVFLVTHVGGVFLAYALFFVASLTSAAYIFQVQRLKRRKTTGIFQRMPSLERLDHTLYLLISMGYPMFIITMILGLVWAWVDNDLLNVHWWLSLKVILSWAMLIFYAFAFHARRIDWLRGRKLAYVVFFGFTTLLAVYMVRGLLNEATYNFLDKAS